MRTLSLGDLALALVILLQCTGCSQNKGIDTRAKTLTFDPERDAPTLQGGVAKHGEEYRTTPEK